MNALATLCPQCFKDKGARSVCVACGFDESTEKSPLTLPYRVRLDNKYLIGRVLGFGGFSITYLALDSNLAAIVAIKEYLPRELAGRGEDKITVSPHTGKEAQLFQFGLDRFVEEARVLEKCRDPHIVRVRTFFKQNATAYLVMDYYNGTTLDEYLRKRGCKLSESQAVKLMSGVLDGLREVHGQGYLHRDIKPENIFITQDERPVLIDFGAARYAVSQQSQKSVTVMLTPGFAPYEQYHRRGNQGPWTDLYACGATLYSMLTGQDPPEATERRDKDELIPPKQLVPTLSDRLNLAILKALAINPEKRFQTAEEFIKFLNDPVQGKRSFKCEHCRFVNELESYEDPRQRFCNNCGNPLVRQTVIEPPREPVVDPEPSPPKRRLPKKSPLVPVAVVLLIIVAIVLGSLAFMEEYATLTITSEPSDAIVYLNGKEVGKTPYKGKGLKPSRYAVEVKKEFYQPWSQSIRLEAGDNDPIKAKLDLLPQDKSSKVNETTQDANQPQEKPSKVNETTQDANQSSFTNDYGMKFVLIPSDVFTMGSPTDEPSHQKDEAQHKVKISKPFYMQTTEVTQKQWEDVMGYNPSYHKNCSKCPVETVSWNEVQDFIKKLNAKTGKVYRLPTEAEWEYSARAGTTTPFAFGNCLSTNDANYNGNYPLEGCPKGEYREGTIEVGSLNKANDWGLYDMHGNVWEWVQDRYGVYQTSTGDAPIVDPVGPGSGASRVLRGGSWDGYGQVCRSAFRSRLVPDYRNDYYGFRLVLSVGQ